MANAAAFAAAPADDKRIVHHHMDAVSHVLLWLNMAYSQPASQPIHETELRPQLVHPSGRRSSPNCPGPCTHTVNSTSHIPHFTFRIALAIGPDRENRAIIRPGEGTLEARVSRLSIQQAESHFHRIEFFTRVHISKVMARTVHIFSPLHSALGMAWRAWQRGLMRLPTVTDISLFYNAQSYIYAAAAEYPGTSLYMCIYSTF